MTVTVREAELQDVQIVIALIRELARQEGDETLVSEAYVLSYLAYPGNEILLAEVEGRVAGLLSYSVRPNLYHAGEVCLIEELVVGEKARGRGAGSALVNKLINRAKERGYAEISVSTMPDNEQAASFYRKRGFTDEAILLEQHL